MENLLGTDACTLPTDERPLRLAEFDELLAGSVRDVEQYQNSLRMELTGGPGFAERVRDLAQREMSCCSFFTITVEGSDHDLTLTIAVPPARREVLDALATRAQEGGTGA